MSTEQPTEDSLDQHVGASVRQEVYDALWDEAKERRTSNAEIIREALEEYLMD